MIDGNCTWEQFKDRAAELSERAKGSTLLFRGQASANWGLQTTLERSGHDETVPRSEWCCAICRTCRKRNVNHCR